MAAEDLRRDWQRERGPTWAIDTGLPGTADPTPEAIAGMTAETKGRAIPIALGETSDEPIPDGFPRTGISASTRIGLTGSIDR
jgi:hypothetical protein